MISIGTYLKQQGHKVKIYDRCIDKNGLKTVVKSFNPQSVGISVMSSRGLKDAIKVSKAIKSEGITVVWGGQLSTMQAELVLENDYVDIVSLGEGEET